MPLWCVVDSMHAEWIISELESGTQECISQGGHVVNRPASCGASVAAMHSFEDLSESGIAGQTSALAVVPLRLFRATFEESPLMVQLNQLNRLAGDGLEDIFANDEVLGEKVQDAFIKLSMLASTFSENTDEGLSQIHYTKETHEGIAEVALAVASYTNNGEFRAALEEMVKTAEDFVGMNFRDIKDALNISHNAA